MNTNSNVYTIIYTTIVVVVVAAVLAFVAMTLQPKQLANEKAETISQIMTAAQLGTKAEITANGNDAVLALYSENVAEAYVVNLKGDKVRDLNTSKDNIELVSNFKPEDKAIKNGGEPQLPVYVFKNGSTVIPVYGAGLWGPVWGYIAVDKDVNILGAYFDHQGETPGLGAKIKDDPDFQESFKTKTFNLANKANPFDIVKGGAPAGNNAAVDAITGATVTCNGLNAAIDVWVGAYADFLTKLKAEEE